MALTSAESINLILRVPIRAVNGNGTSRIVSLTALVPRLHSQLDVLGGEHMVHVHVQLRPALLELALAGGLSGARGY